MGGRGGGGGGGGGRQIWWKIIKLRMRMRLSLFFFSERMKDIIQNESCCHRWLFSNLYIWNRFGRKMWDGYIKSRWLTLTRQTSTWRKSISTYRIYKWGTIKRTSFYIVKMMAWRATFEFKRAELLLEAQIVKWECYTKVHLFPKY